MVFCMDCIASHISGNVYVIAPQAVSHSIKTSCMSCQTTSGSLNFVNSSRSNHKQQLSWSFPTGSLTPFHRGHLAQA